MGDEQSMGMRIASLSKFGDELKYLREMTVSFVLRQQRHISTQWQEREIVGVDHRPLFRMLAKTQQGQLDKVNLGEIFKGMLRKM